MSGSQCIGLRRSLARALSWCVLLWMLSVAACDGCGDGPAVATLLEARGPDVQRDFAAQMRAWQPAQKGDRFYLGDGVRTGPQATARLSLIDQTHLELAPGTTLRFMVDGANPGEDALNVEAGEVSMRANRDLLLRTHIGLAKVLSGTQLTLTRKGENLEYEVAVGEATFRDASGAEQSLKAGESLEIGIGMALLAPRAGTQPVVEELMPEAPPGAVLANVKTPGVRSRKPSGTWSKLAAGRHALEPGTELRLARKDAVELSRDNQQATLQGAGEYVVGSGNALVEAREGDLSVRAAQDDVTVVVPGGSIIVRGGDGGSEADVRIGAEVGQVAMKRGTSTLELLGETSELSAGQEHRWTHTNPESADKRAIEPSLAYHNLSVRAGESFTLHAPEVPVAVRLDLPGKCPGDLIVELVKSKVRVRGKDQASLSLGTGSHPYVVRCIDEKGTLSKVVTRANIQVLHDAGTRRLPAKPPTSYVETDGRTYTIYYQNQLPDISVRWPNPPPSASYELLVDDRPMTLSKPEHLFRSGTVRDGTHHLSFRAGDRRSRTTKIEVRFDNAAPKASLSSPTDRGFKSGDKVTIEGVALETWKVSIEGGTVNVDGSQRFVGEVTTSADRPDVAVRLAHPRLGVHYYLRRAAGSP